MIRLLAMDVDGTLTDGGIFLDASGNEFKRFDVQDGMGISMLRNRGIEIALISGRYSAATERRAEELKISHLYNGVSNKFETLNLLAEKLNIGREEVAYMGDDINDRECIEWAGLGIAVANARKEVRESADMITQCGGGAGALREVADMLLSDAIKMEDGDNASKAP